jgi:1-acyl-sn-glycerol-3-phosphate acyltransferase
MAPILHTAVAAFRTLSAYVVCTLYALMAGPPGILLAIALGRPIILYRLGAFGNWLLLRVSGIRYHVEGPGGLLHDRSAIYCFNHASNLEPPIAFLLLQPLFPKLRVIYKKSLRRLPILGRCFEIGGFIPIDRRDSEQSRQALADAAQALRDGNSFMMFPEGTRSRTGELLPFKKGAFVLAIDAQAPLVPVAIIGAQRAMRRGSPFIWPARITVRIGLPVDAAGATYDDRDRLMDEVRASIARMIEGAGALHPHNEVPRPAGAQASS